MVATMIYPDIVMYTKRIQDDLGIDLHIYSGTQIAMDIKSGKYPQVQGNIATPKLIQWKTAKMRGNKSFRGFGGFIFSFFEPFFRFGSCFAIQICTSF